MQKRLEHADDVYRIDGHKSIVTRLAELDCTGQGTPVLRFSATDIRRRDGSLASMTSNELVELCTLSSHVDGGQRDHAKLFRDARLALELWYHETGITAALLMSNIASALLRLRHYGLALSYAMAATRFSPKPSPKALYRAAYAAAALHEPHAALYFLQQVRACWCVQQRWQ